MGAATIDTNTRSCPPAQWTARLVSFPTVYDMPIWACHIPLEALGLTFWMRLSEFVSPWFWPSGALEPIEIICVSIRVRFSCLVGYEKLEGMAAKGVLKQQDWQDLRDMERASPIDLSGCWTECPTHFCWPFPLFHFRSGWFSEFSECLLQICHFLSPMTTTTAISDIN